MGTLPTSETTIHKFWGLCIFEEIKDFIQQGHIKFIKSDSKDML